MQTASKLSIVCRSAACRPLFWRFRPTAASAHCNASAQPPAFSQQALAALPAAEPPRRSAITTMAQATAQAADLADAPVAVDPKLAQLREILASSKGGGPVDALIIPSEDPHMSEYPPQCDARREFISGFDGSAGTVVVTAAAAALWTDGRYFLQAEQQLGPGWTLMKAGTPGCPEIHDWLISNLPDGARVGIDPTCHTIEAAQKLHAQLEAAGRSLVTLPANPVDAVWGGGRPAPPQAPLRVHALEWAGATVGDKLAAVRKELGEAGAGALMVTMLDEVAWLLNLRGGDVPYNPVFLSYAIVTTEGATLYVDPGKVTAAAARQLEEAQVAVKAYSEAFNDVRALAAVGTKIWMDPARVSFAVRAAAVEAAGGGDRGKSGGASGSRKRARPPAESANGAAAAAAAAAAKAVVLERTSPVYLAKAVKNGAELAGMREAHLRDGVALVKFVSWLERTIAAGETLTECQVDEELTARRAAQPGFVELSFPTIAGAGPNGAVIHYRPHPDTCRTVDAATLLLLDSGGQYDCGTTDITRTMHMGTPTDHQRACFTAVLQGHIQLDSAIWPEGTPGCALDTLARTALWRLGLNYRHGTGHGVGAALNVHEGPQSISSRFWNTQALLPAMVCSNEPGYYEDGAFGIRIENLFVVVEAPTPFRFAAQPYYTCSRITLCPLQKKMIDTRALSPQEVAWVDDYHREVYEALAPRLEAEGAAEEVAWLKQATSPL